MKLEALNLAFQRLRESVPERGFLIVVPPPRADGSFPDCLASIWRRGDTRTVRHRGRSPAHAVGAAVRAEGVSGRKSQELRNCPLCRGIGWSIGTGGGAVLCRHALPQGNNPVALLPVEEREQANGGRR